MHAEDYTLTLSEEEAIRLRAAMIQGFADGIAGREAGPDEMLPAKYAAAAAASAAGSWQSTTRL